MKMSKDGWFISVIESIIIFTLCLMNKNVFFYFLLRQGVEATTAYSCSPYVALIVAGALSVGVCAVISQWYGEDNRSSSFELSKDGCLCLRRVPLQGDHPRSRCIHCERVYQEK
jgi:hypothetical protein